MRTVQRRADPRLRILEEPGEVTIVRKPIGLLAASILASTLVGVVVAPGVSSASTAPPGSGMVGCKVVGTATFSPALTRHGSPGGDKFQMKVKGTSCGGQVTGGGAVVTVTGVKLTVTGFWNPANKCASLPTDTLGAVTWKYHWISSPAIAPTTVVTSGGTPWVPSGTIWQFNFPSGGTITSSSGSFAPVAPMTDVFNTAMPNACAPGWGPYPSTTITNTGSNFVVN